jgi:hypothetical protein
MRNLRKAILVLIAGLLWASGAAARDPYPIIFESVQQLKRYGLVLPLPGPDPIDASLHFANRCYYYGDGGLDLSISDELLSFYKAQGFSRRSACLALVSGIRFNPVSGQRLATYVLVDRKILKPKDNDPDALSNELPFSLPGCFAGGTPYSDCAWNYDPLSGKKLGPRDAIDSLCRNSPAEGGKLCDHRWTGQEAGKRIEAYLSGQQRCADTRAAPVGPDQDVLAIRCRFQATIDPSDPSESVRIAWNTSATLIDYSGDFPKGHGYSLYAQGIASPGVSPDAVKAAFNGAKPQSQIDPRRLRELWGAGTK